MFWNLLLAASLSLQYVAKAHGQSGFLDPKLSGGSMLTSSPRVLAETMWEGGLYNYLEAAGFGGECLGLQMGNYQQSNLGDGNRNQTQRSILRYQYFHDDILGTCLESIYGGNHIRVFRQETSGAYFFSTSAEMDSTTHHNLGLNAYDLGRNLFVGNATGVVIGDDVTTSTVIEGGIEKRGYRYKTVVTFEDGLLPENRTLWNHYTGVQLVGGAVSDGLVAVLTIDVLSTP
ncbi:uncharacterized protein L203_102570 [Cryptococcus depauperatus CBS 7841]|uniref:Uncharacterized protein n=1 Tax=Cryptococcus depauperatus CBS 7841 TaxID=1295531 RepID=A0AAJ8M185_9TREE